ncbi:MAG: BlaI/MecI/CopY family transcriptional regulator [Gammaproteobacteria bacterium]
MTKRETGVQPPKPTVAELGILLALWHLGPTTVGQIRDLMAEDNDVGYTTVLKLLQIMHQKGLVERDESQRAHVYMPRLSKEQTQQQMVGDLVSRLFDGSPSKLVLQALGSTEQASTQELGEIRELLDRIESTEAQQ